MLKGKVKVQAVPEEQIHAGQEAQNQSGQADQWKPNTTVAAIVEREGKFLVVEEYAHGRLVLNQPAGHLEENESLIDAVVREVREETAWGFVPESVTGLYLYPSPRKNITYLRICFAGQVEDYQADLSLDEGIQRTLWMTEEELGRNAERLRTPLVLECIRDYRAGKHMPLSMVKARLGE